MSSCDGVICGRLPAAGRGISSRFTAASKSLVPAVHQGQIPVRKATRNTIRGPATFGRQTEQEWGSVRKPSGAFYSLLTRLRFSMQANARLQPTHLSRRLPQPAAAAFPRGMPAPPPARAQPTARRHPGRTFAAPRSSAVVAAAPRLQAVGLAVECWRGRKNLAGGVSIGPRHHEGSAACPAVKRSYGALCKTQQGGVEVLMQPS